MLILVVHCKIKESLSSSLELFLAGGASQIDLSSAWFLSTALDYVFFFYQYDFLKNNIGTKLVYQKHRHTELTEDH